MSANTLMAQTRISSPYTRYGLGDIQTVKHPVNMAMGGITYGFKSPFYINYNNPASLADRVDMKNDSSSFVFEGNLSGSMVTLKTSNITQESNYASLNSLLFAFPIAKKWWGSSFGLIPFSTTGYKIHTVANHDTIGEVDYYFEGEGGINQVYWAHGFRIDSNFFVGFNASYLFGTMEKTRSVYSDSAYFFNTEMKTSRRVGDIYLTFGFQHEKRFKKYERKKKKKLSLVSGLTFNFASKIAAKDDILAQTFSEGSTGLRLYHDTISSVTDLAGDINLPTRIGAGFCLQKSDMYDVSLWLIGADVTYQNWSEFSSFGVNDSLKNSLQLSAGGQFTPKHTYISSYYKRITYRMGIRYHQTYLELNNNQIDEFGISFGVGLPMKGKARSFNIGFEYGQRGTTSNSLIQENFFKVSLGLSLYNTDWFRKPKYR